MNTPSRHCSGFTLIELLVVIAIITMLVSILLPALQKARQQAVRLKCLTQVKTIGTGALMYASDNQEWGLPKLQWGETFAFGGQPQKWVPYYFPRTETRGSYNIKTTFVCPDADPAGIKDHTYQYGRLTSGRLATSYFFHFSTGTRNPTQSNSHYGNIRYNKSTRQLHRVNAPRITMLNWVDPATWLGASLRPVYLPGPTEQPIVQDVYNKSGQNRWRRGTKTDYKMSNHYMQGGHNIGYIDGHAKWQSGDEAIARHKDFYNTYYY